MSEKLSTFSGGVLLLLDVMESIHEHNQALVHFHLVLKEINFCVICGRRLAKEC